MGAGAGGEAEEGVGGVGRGGEGVVAEVGCGGCGAEFREGAVGRGGRCGCAWEGGCFWGGGWLVWWWDERIRKVAVCEVEVVVQDEAAEEGGECVVEDGRGGHLGVEGEEDQM